MAVAASMKMVTLRPPIRSVRIPAGSRHSDPFNTARALIQASSTSEISSSFWIWMPSTPNISQTANITVKSIVDITRTRFAPGPVGWTGGISSSPW